MISSEENDQFAGANVGRATRPTPANCDGVMVACRYAAGQDGELAANLKGWNVGRGGLDPTDDDLSA